MFSSCCDAFPIWATKAKVRCFICLRNSVGSPSLNAPAALLAAMPHSPTTVCSVFKVFSRHFTIFFPLLVPCLTSSSHFLSSSRGLWIGFRPFVRQRPFIKCGTQSFKVFIVIVSQNPLPFMFCDLMQYGCLDTSFFFFFLRKDIHNIHIYHVCASGWFPVINQAVPQPWHRGDNTRGSIYTLLCSSIWSNMAPSWGHCIFAMDSVFHYGLFPLCCFSSSFFFLQ